LAENTKNIPVLILAGGYGTRLKPFTIDLPKPMVPFVNRPIFEHLVRLLKNEQFTNINPLLLYRPEKLTGYFKEGRELGVDFEYHISSEDFGTAGSVGLLRDRLKSTFIVMNGDIITDVQVSKVLEFHRQKGGLATIMLAKVQNPLPFGIAIVDDNLRIKRFVEKPSQAELISDLVNAGIYILEPEIFKYIPEDQPFFFAMDLFPLLLRKGLPLYGFVHEGYWQDIGDLRQYLLSHYDYLKGKFKLPDLPHKINELNIGTNSEVGNNVEFEGTVIIGDNCKIGDSVRIVRSVIGSNVQIGAGTELYDSIIWSKSKIGNNTRIVSDIIASGTSIGNRVYFDDNVFVGENCEIDDLSVLKSNVKIWPGKKIESGSTVTNSMVWGARWLKDIFTGSRISGTINQEISPEFGAKLGAAFGAYLGKSSSVLVSWDGSPAARMINRSIICGLMSVGVNIRDLQVLPMPIHRFALQTGSYQGGVQVRQSRIKENYLEIVVLQSDGQDLSAQQAKSVERLFIQEDFSRVNYEAIGKLDYPVRVVESYQEQYLINLATKSIEKAKFKIVIDYSFGPASTILPSILGSLDCEVVAINAYMDSAHTIRHWADFRYALLQLGNIVTSLKADVGFLIDSSSERIFVVDEDGHYLKDEYLLVLVTKLFLQIFRHSFIGMPVSAPMILNELALNFGTQIIPTSIDLRSMAETIQNNQLSFIGDGEGRFVFPEFHFASDGMFAMGKILELIALNQIRLKDLQNIVPLPIMAKNVIPCPRDHIGQILRELVEQLKENCHSTSDGVKLQFPDGWLLVTPSQLEPALILVAEAKDRDKVEQKLEEYSLLIETMIKKVKQFV
jgi:mannose-1-phosphate guanylyltransferase / phosphomannomutase